jgi:acetolactate synthase I/II/III large subunit
MTNTSLQHRHGHGDANREDLLAPTAVTVSDAIADVIDEHSGAVFGLMGNGNAYVVSNLTTRGTRFVSARHEAGTVAMADAYFRASGKIATATVTYGAGFTNTFTALAEARQARIPLVLVVGDAPTTGRRPWDIDQSMAAKALGIETLVVNAENATALTNHAFTLALSENTPVIIAIPYDLATAELAAQKPLPVVEPVSAPAVESRQAAVVAAKLQSAKRPLIIAGRGAFESNAAPALKEIGDRLGARFATSVMARNLFESEWDLGIAGGFARERPVNLMRNADVVLVMGASLNLFQMRYGTLLDNARSIIQIDRLSSATHAQVTDFIEADAAEFADALLAHIRPQSGSTWRDEVFGAEAGGSEDESERASDARLNPRPFARELETILPTERTIVQDGGHFSGWMPLYCSAPDPHGLMLVGTAYQTIGLGFPAAVGAAVARPDRTTVLVTGDGGGLMALPDLETLIRTAKSCVVVVFNDAAYGAELHQYATRGLDKTAMLIDEVDFAAVGRAFGAVGIKARSLSDLEALREWVAEGANGVFVLDVPVSQEVVAEYMQESVAASHGKAGVKRK